MLFPRPAPFFLFHRELRASLKTHPFALSVGAAASLALTTLALTTFTLTTLAVAPASAATFKNQTVARDADRYEAFLKKNWQPGQRDIEALKRQARQLIARGRDPRRASRHLAMAVVANRRDAVAWLNLARALLAIRPNAGRSNERYHLPVNASASAYRAYQLSPRDAIRAEALHVMGKALQRRSYWRPALEALKASLALAEQPAVRAAYKRLRAEKGFRIVNYKVQSDAAQPRLCVRFSEALAKGAADFATFVRVNGADPQAVTASGQRLCISGLRHGQRYSVQVRAGLPSRIGERLLKSADLGVYVRDRSPAVRFKGRNYVLPNKGQQGIPLISVNAKTVAVEVFRLADRSLATTLQGGTFGKPVWSYQLDEIRKRTGARAYKGTLNVASVLNKDVATAFPVSDALPRLKPGAYLITARVPGAKGANSGKIASQWFIVSDLGLTAFSGSNGVHAFVRSLETTAVKPGVRVKLVARNNEVLGEAVTNAQGYARFPAALARGEGGMAPALISAFDGADYAFMSLATAPFDLTDRGVKGRPAPGAVDAYLFTERGVYRPGAKVHLTGLVRDARA
ncbi:MAG: alpha-2-macroglobulin family protein, partial [Pseudomonadota bacterium]